MTGHILGVRKEGGELQCTWTTACSVKLCGVIRMPQKDMKKEKGHADRMWNRNGQNFFFLFNNSLDPKGTQLGGGTLLAGQ